MRAKDRVDARYAEPITVDDLAAGAGLSRAHFARTSRARSVTRRGPICRRGAWNVSLALLRYTDRSVADICATVGLSSVGSFTSSFARVDGKAARRLPCQPAACVQL